MPISYLNFSATCNRGQGEKSDWTRKANNELSSESSLHVNALTEEKEEPLVLLGQRQSAA